EAGGEALICEARLIDGLSDQDVCSLFNSARDTDYAEIADEARSLSRKSAAPESAESQAELKTQFARLKSRYAQTVAIDFFDATGRLTVENLIGGIDRSLTRAEGEAAMSEASTVKTQEM